MPRVFTRNFKLMENLLSRYQHVSTSELKSVMKKLLWLYSLHGLFLIVGPIKEGEAFLDCY